MRLAAFASILFTLLLSCASPAPAQIQPLTAWWVDTGESDTTSLGMSVAALGDLNGDGFDDFIVGSSEEKAFVYFGNTQPDTIPRMSIPSPDMALSLFAKSLYGIGDVNNDGSEDFIAWGVVSQIPDHCRAYVFFGGVLLDTVPDLVLDGEETAVSNFGQNGMEAGDFNGDGGLDFIVLDDEYRAVQADTIEGRAYIYFGGAVLDSIPDWQVSGGNPFSTVGTDAAALGDVNNDGYDDIVLVDRRATGPEGEYAMGYAAVYYGAANPDTLPDIVLWGEESYAALGQSVAGIDFNHDGVKDIVVGSHRDYPPDHLTSVYVYLVSAGMGPTPDYIFPDQGNLNNTTGRGLLGIDLNGDGWQDIVSNNYENALGAGKTYVYLGGIYADTLLDAIFYEGHIMCSLGAGFANVGDINDDGVEDMAIGEPGYYFYLYESHWGRVYMILGDTTYHQSVGVPPIPPEQPSSFTLTLNAFPNPFNQEVRIQYSLKVPTNQKGTLSIFNLRGEVIETSTISAGEGEYVWNAQRFSSGIYFVRINTTNTQITKKIVLLR